MTVRTERTDDGVAVITLDRPERKNAFDGEQWDATAAALVDTRDDGRVAAVVITGAGGDFSAGVDLSSFGDQKERPDGFSSDYEAFMHALIEFDKPLLAAMDGAAIGIGATLPLHCDVVYVGAGLRLRFPFVSLGLVPEGAASVLLERAVGLRVASQLLLAAEWIDGDAAVRHGLADAVYPSTDLLGATVDRARRLAAWPISALQGTKRTMLAARRDDVLAAIAREMRGMTELAMSPENIEAVTAFMDKRDPDFTQFRR
ncbi:MAG: enoyl-CoA hydratase/isomerase family protein [Acidimicrobiales bacterium]